MIGITCMYTHMLTHINAELLSWEVIVVNLFHAPRYPGPRKWEPEWFNGPFSGDINQACVLVVVLTSDGGDYWALPNGNRLTNP